MEIATQQRYETHEGEGGNGQDKVKGKVKTIHVSNPR